MTKYETEIRNLTEEQRRGYWKLRESNIAHKRALTAVVHESTRPKFRPPKTWMVKNGGILDHDAEDEDDIREPETDEECAAVEAERVRLRNTYESKRDKYARWVGYIFIAIVAIPILLWIMLNFSGI